MLTSFTPFERKWRAACWEESNPNLTKLLALPSMQAYAAYGGNMALLVAVETGDYRLLVMLLSLPVVRANNLESAWRRANELEHWHMSIVLHQVFYEELCCAVYLCNVEYIDHAMKFSYHLCSEPFLYTRLT